MQSDDHDLNYPNAPWRLWQLLDPTITPDDWQAAVYHALYILEDLPAMNAGRDLTSLIDSILTERQFGSDHWRLSSMRRAYYSFVRPILPASIRPMLRRLLLARQRERHRLGWPIEDRYIRFQVAMLRYLLAQRGGELPYVTLWPNGKRFALVLTHDVESASGHDFVRCVMDLEERYGFRSSFNFVAEDYPVDERLLDEVKARGFEIGVHGLRHDDQLFSSRKVFKNRAIRINSYLQRWGAVGFRAPFTHRHPDWMQALKAEYDSTFFDTDPFETVPGGTMSIWPFQMGRITELPFTMTQDHTLIYMLGETTPRLWLDKVSFIERHGGMVMLVTHPDYLRDPLFFSVYERFLQAMSARRGYWHALPRDVAGWWRRRMQLPGLGLGVEDVASVLPDATIGTISVGEQWADDSSSLRLVLGPMHPAVATVSARQHPATG